MTKEQKARFQNVVNALSALTLEDLTLLEPEDSNCMVSVLSTIKTKIPIPPRGQKQGGTGSRTFLIELLLSLSSDRMD